MRFSYRLLVLPKLVINGPQIERGHHCLLYTSKSHAAVSVELLGSEDLVASVLRDVESSPLPENEKALLRFARKVTLDLPNY